MGFQGTPFTRSYADFYATRHLTAPDAHRENGSIRKQEAGPWRVQVHRKGVSENFVRYGEAKRWAVDAKRWIDRGEAPTPSRIGKLQTFGDLIDPHISDMKGVGKAPGRSKGRHAQDAQAKTRLAEHTLIEEQRAIRANEDDRTRLSCSQRRLPHRGPPTWRAVRGCANRRSWLRAGFRTFAWAAERRERLERTPTISSSQTAGDDVASYSMSTA
jgi:hypothetical protein